MRGCKYKLKFKSLSLRSKKNCLEFSTTVLSIRSIFVLAVHLGAYSVHNVDFKRNLNRILILLIQNLYKYDN